MDVSTADPYVSLSGIAASTYVKHPSIKRKFRLTDSQLEELDSAISKTLSIIESNNFKLIRHRQSSKSYSYYILFVPTDANGDQWPYPARIQFEIREHNRNDGTSGGWVNSSLHVITFDIGNNKCLHLSGLTSKVKRICFELKEGDYSQLEPFPRS